jgi:hypothetical protein
VKFQQTLLGTELITLQQLIRSYVVVRFMQYYALRHDL